MDFRNQEGRIAETILTEYFLRRNYYVFAPMAAHGPVDLVVIHRETGEVVLLDAKKEHVRELKDRPNPHRIHRLRKPIQKKMGVRLAYVDIDNRTVHIVPAIEDDEEIAPSKSDTQ